MHNYIKFSENKEGLLKLFKLDTYLILHFKNYSDYLGINTYSTSSDNKFNQNQIDGALQTIPPMGSNTYSRNAKIVREKLTNYFIGEGALEFQYDKI